MSQLLTYFIPRRTLPRDTTSIPPTPALVPSRAASCARNSWIVQPARRTAARTIPREAPAAGVAPLPILIPTRRGARLAARRARGWRPFVPQPSQDRLVSPWRSTRRDRAVPLPWRLRTRIPARTFIVHVGDLDAFTPITIDEGPPFLGGFLLTGIEWASSHAIAVFFDSTYDDDYLYQLYAGRTLIAATTDSGQRSLIGQMTPSDWPQALTLLAVDPADRLTDFGPRLPLRPFNRVRLRWSSVGMPSDTRYIELTAGAAAGAAVDLDNVIALVPFDMNRFYEFTTDPLSGSGTWNFEVAHRDDKKPDGNRGTAAAISATIVAIPPDVDAAADGSRFTLAIASGVATATFTYPS